MSIFIILNAFCLEDHTGGISKSLYNKILVIHTWGIGDLIMLTPTLRILRDNFPRAQIDIFISQSSAAEVLCENSIINRIFKFDWRKSNFLDNLKFILKLRKEKYDLVIVPTGVNPLLGSLFAYLIGGKIRVGEYKKFKTPFYTHQVKANGNLHKVHSNINLLRAIGIEIKKIPKPFFEFRKKDKEFAKNFIDQINGKNKILIGFHPGAGEKQWFKVWNKNNFIELGLRILESYDNIYLILFGGPKEKELCEEIKDKIGRREVFLATNFDLKKIAALINSCHIFISSDSGLAHIASTTKTNLIVIFGPTSPERTGPVGQRVFVVKEKCSYPYNDLLNSKYDIKRTHKCLERITPDRILKEIEKILKEQMFKTYGEIS
jgi:lipopolysaccharide heptosyltransferase II